MAYSDVSLDQPAGGWVTIQADVVNSTAHDLILGSADRMKVAKAGGTTYRRALVHDFDDGLTINWANDYTGGVTIRGVAHLYPKSAGDDEVFGRLGGESNIAVHGGIVYQTRTRGRDLVPQVTEHNLGMEIAQLQRQVAYLTARVAALEAR